MDCLSQYCSSFHRDDLIKQFESCINVASLDPSVYPAHEIQEIKEKSQNIFLILEKIMTSLNVENTSKNETKHLFLDILNLVKIANSHSKLKFCVSSICSLFKNCEFPIDIEYKNFENDAMVAARIAALLTGFIVNEKQDERTYLSKSNLYTLMRLIISEYDNIYDSKLAYIRYTDEDRLIIHATKSFRDNGNYLFLSHL